MKDKFTVDEYREISKLISIYKALSSNYERYKVTTDKSTLLSTDMVELFEELFKNVTETFEELFVTMGIPHVIENHDTKEPF